MESHQTTTPQWKAAPDEVMGVLKDLTRKAQTDTMRALSTTLDLGGEVAGPAGLFGITQKVMGLLAVGSAMAYTAMRCGTQEATKAAMRSAEPGNPKVNLDDLLYVLLCAYASEAAEEESRDDITRYAAEMFERFRGYPHEQPEQWASLMPGQQRAAR